MRNNQPVTQRERVLKPGETIISTTDLKGKIVSVNDDFLHISGFEEQELIGQPHNIVRHPDMPVEAFKDLWQTVASKKPWMGIVKNRCKNGDFYLVDAYVTPVYEGDQIVGYQSVRLKADPSVVERATQIYESLRKQKSQWLAGFKPANISYVTKGVLLSVLAAMPAALLAVQQGGAQLWLLALVTFAVTGLFGYGLLQPLLALTRRSRQLFDNDLACQVYTGRRDEVGQLELVIKALRAQNRTILGRVDYASEVLGGVAGETNQIVEQTTEGVRRQQMEVDQMATAMNEMAATVAEVAKNAEQTAAASSDVLGQTSEGESLVKSAVADIAALSQAVSDATAVIEKLKVDSENIGSVVDVISNIASETNLLALNAAIEAARAGEQGRGFAVVADEVRNLASNTQKSTDEIQQMIKTIQASSSEAVAAMEEGRRRADQSVAQANQVGNSFGSITRAVNDINALNTQVATAAEEQSVVAEEINRNVVAINTVAGQTLDNANQTAAASGQLTAMVERLRSMVKQFGQL